MTRQPSPAETAAAQLVALVVPSGAGGSTADPAAVEGCVTRRFALAGGRPAWSVEAIDPPAVARIAARGPRAGAALRRAAARDALRRQRRLEALAGYGTVLPAAPATPPPADLAAFAQANAPTLDAAFDRLAGRAQYQVRVAWNAGRAPRRFAAAPEFAQLPQRPGRAGRQAALAALGRRLGDGISARLAATASDAIRLPGGQDGLANLALLVDEAGRVGLEAALEEIDALWTEGLRIRLVGPSPALSFARAQLETVDAGAIAAAARRLGADPDQPPDPAAIPGLRRRALARAGAAGSVLPAEIDRAAAVLGVCARLGQAPARAGEATLLSLARDGLPLAPSSEAAFQVLSEVA